VTAALRRDLLSSACEGLHDVAPAQYWECRHLDGDVDLLNLDCKGHTSLGADFQASGDGVANIFEGFRTRLALTDATWNRRAFHNPHSVLITIDRRHEFHVAYFTRCAAVRKLIPIGVGRLAKRNRNFARRGTGRVFKSGGVL
jgi:hypothetical protein